MADALVDLVEAGAITNAHKGVSDALTVAGTAFGTERLYRDVEDNPEVEFQPVSFTHAPTVLGALRRPCAIDGTSRSTSPAR